jgi:hypothetical protein
MPSHPSRRHFLGALAGAAALPALALAGEAPRRPRVAAVYTVCFRRSHAHVILENFLRPFLFNGRVTQPAAEVVSLYADQFSRTTPDMTRDLARQFNLPLFERIEDALTLGGRDLAVDAVLSIGEHGDYPVNRLGQREYPRKRFFDECVAAMRRHDRFVPIFNDKHLSYRWDWAREMFDTARRHRIPFMAGSSVPLAERRPATDVPAGAAIEEIVSVHGGPFESYDFHGLEILQSIAEARRGGETGLRSVEFLSGDALVEAARQGRWSPRLAEAALAAEFAGDVPDWRRPLDNETPHGILLTYADGLRAAVLKVGRSSIRWNLACKLAGEERPRAFRYHVGPWNNRCLFMALSHAIQHFFTRRESPYPVERTLLTTGALEAAVRSRAEGRRIDTPHLAVAYAPRDFRALRELGESWRVLPEDAKEPPAFGALPIRR